MTKKTIIGSIVILVIGVAIGFAASFIKAPTSTQVGATVENFPTWYYGGIQLGPNSHVLNNVDAGTCSLASATTLATGTLATYDCAVANAKVGDVSFVRPSSAITYGWDLRGSSVATAGLITVAVQNDSSTTTIPAAVKTSLKYLIIR